MASSSGNRRLRRVEEIPMSSDEQVTDFRNDRGSPDEWHLLFRSVSSLFTPLQLIVFHCATLDGLK